MGSGDASTAELGIRLLGSLAVVVGLLVLLARLVNRRFKAPAGAAVQVVCRQSLTRSSGVAVVTVGTRVLVLGTTEHQVTLLAEVEPDEVGLDEVGLDEVGLAEVESAGKHRSTGDSPGLTGLATPDNPRRAPVKYDGALAGSILSPQTWKQTFAAFGGSRSTTADDESAPEQEAS
ncbi:flagellar biosynthetic protein FliO [Nocardioides panacisoli]|uniref:Flagellar protein n=1 Tax=Nocardioides panacisoli TaxID=627624 RepID=A0ABP7HS07_9ACTN